MQGGADNSASNDPDHTSRTASNAGGNTGNNVGSLQNDATKLPNSNFSVSTAGDHTHPEYAMGGGGATTSILYAGANGSPAQANVNTGTAGSHSHTISGGDGETRPKNVYVNYIIKY